MIKAYHPVVGIDIAAPIAWTAIAYVMLPLVRWFVGRGDESILETNLSMGEAGGVNNLIGNGKD
jgi:hypothetical protein